MRRLFAIAKSVPYLRCLAIALGVGTLSAAEEPATVSSAAKLFDRENLVAWCIVPFDAKRRGPEERAAMLERLGFKRFAYDWRDEHVPTFDAEINALRRHGVKLEAFWFPATLDNNALTILDLLRRHKLRTQLWITMGDPAPDGGQAAKIAAACRSLRPIAEEAGRIGCSVALYNHGGWFGEPKNQLAVIDALGLANVGIVYNLHHGHDHVERFAGLLKEMLPHLVALNLNGMVPDGDRIGKKIVPLGQGELDLELLKIIRDSGYRGPIGILGHTMDDAEERLRDNLDGLDWLLPQLAGRPAGPKPKPRTYSEKPAAGPGANGSGGWLAEGRDEYRTPPLTVECRVKLNQKAGYNILVASDTKQSAAHWEIFSMAGNGRLTAYLPGMQPDHVHSQVDIADGRWHDVAMQLEPERVRLFCDGKLAAEETVRSRGGNAVPGRLAFGRLVEGGIGCDGALEFVRLSRGVREIGGTVSMEADAQTIGLWRFHAGQQPAEDLSRFKNPAKTAASAPPAPAFVPPPGAHLAPADPRLKVVFIDRSDDEAFMAVKADSQGRLFVGGREAVFVYEPDEQGGYQPRRELYRFPRDSIIIGLELRGDDLYVQTANALYLLPEARVMRDGLRPQRLLWGLPLDLHVSFHCLAWGPHGDLYLDHGDPLLNYGDWSRPDHWGHWTLFPRPEGTRVPYTGTGAVLRVKPDGSDVRVVAGGLRGPVGLAFDGDWNLFTNDNDHESRADQYAPARLLHVTPHIDFAWPRGWMASKSPDRADLVEPLMADMGRGVPCDMTCYDEPYLPDELRGNLLLCRWDRMAVVRCPLRPRGASFESEELPFLTGDDNVRPVGVTVGRGGRVFVTSLYLTGNVVSPYCVSDLVMVTRADDTPHHPFQSYDILELAADELWDQLSSPSLQRRQRAHTEILRRGGDLLAAARGRLARALAADDGVALPHLIWLAAVGGGEEAGRLLERLAAHRAAKVRLQAIRALAEFRTFEPARKCCVAALNDDEPAVRLAALEFFFDSQQPFPLPIVAVMAGGPDDYLRQTASLLLARRATNGQLVELMRSSDATLRLAGVLAIGMRLTIPPAADVPPAAVPLFFPEGNAFFQTSLEFADSDREVKLAELGRIGSYTTAQRWQAAGPNEETQELFDLLMHTLNDAETGVRLQAAYYLSLLRDARAEPLVARTRWEVRFERASKLPPRAVAGAWTVGPLDDRERGLDESHPPEQGAIDLAAEYASAAGPLTWKQTGAKDGRFDSDESFAGQKNASYYLFFRLQSVRRQTALLSLETTGAVRVWHNARPAELGEAKVAGIANALLDVQPGGNDVLLRIHADERAPSVRLSLRGGAGLAIEMPERVDASLLAERLKDAGGQAHLGPEFIEADWPKEAQQGDAGRGRRLFGTLGCVKCHAITADQQAGGAPSLTDARKRFTVPHLVESILLPSKQVVELFRATSLQTTDGRAWTGLVVRETADEVELLLSDATRKTFSTGDIEARQLQNLSPMPAGLVKTPGELRDLLAYLLSDNPLPP